jgi:hypothetical protein
MGLLLSWARCVLGRCVMGLRPDIGHRVWVLRHMVRGTFPKEAASAVWAVKLWRDRRID